MVDQWLRLNTSVAGSMGSIPGWGTKTHEQRQTNKQDIPGGPVVTNPPAKAGDTGSIPGPGTKIPHALGN